VLGVEKLRKLVVAKALREVYGRRPCNMRRHDEEPGTATVRSMRSSTSHDGPERTASHKRILSEYVGLTITLEREFIRH